MPLIPSSLPRCLAKTIRFAWVTAHLETLQVLLPEGHNADAYRKVVLERFDMSLGNGLGKVAGKVFRIGHLGHFNELMLAGTLCGVEMGLELARVPHQKGGISAALDYLANGDDGAQAAAAD